MNFFPGSDTKKQGNFDWILDFSQLQPFFDERYTQLPLKSRSSQKVLVLGCGTATLSESIGNLGYQEVVSCDNDEECIHHMMTQHMRKNPHLKWHTYDIVEGKGDVMFTSSYNEYFDLVVDKGTLDAVYVEGAIYPMLAEVHRFLRPGGCYLVCSINSSHLMRSLLSLPALGLDVNCLQVDVTGKNVAMEGEGVQLRPYDLKGLSRMADFAASESVPVTVAFCHKPHDHVNVVIDQQALQQQEREVSDFFFQDEVPLLTPELEQDIRQRFRTLAVRAGPSGDYLPALHAYTIMFGKEEREEYTEELFLEDLAGFATERSSFLSEEECVRFIREMQ